MQLCFGREEGDVSGSGNTGFVFNSDISCLGTAKLSVFQFHNGTRVEVSGSGGYGNSCDVVQRTVTVGGELEFTDGDQASHFAGGRACSFVHAGFTQCPRVIIICYPCQCSVLSAQVEGLSQSVAAGRGDGCRRVEYGNFILVLYQCRKIARKGIRRVSFSCENRFGNTAGTGFHYGQLAVGVPVALQDACILCI